MKLLPHQFQDTRGDATPQDTINIHNKNLRFTLRTLRNLTGPNLNLPHRPRLDTGANLLRVFDTLQVWMGDETSKGLTLQVLLNLSRVPDEEGEPTQQDLPTPQDSNSDMCPIWKGGRSDQTGKTGSPLAFLHRLETNTHKIERTIRRLQHLPSQHHTTHMLGMTVLDDLTPRGFFLGERTLENREFQWYHSLSGTQFDTLPDLVMVDVKLTYWHCLKASGCTLVGTILVPKSANISELIRMHLWKHPYVAMKSYLQKMTIYNETGDTRKRIPLCTTIRALGSTIHKKNHLLPTDWESGHSDLEPLSQRHLLMENADLNPTGVEANTSNWSQDGGEALSRLGNRIQGGHKLVNMNGSVAMSKLHVTIIDHHTNQCTPWLANMQTTPHRLRILGNPNTRSIDTQIPTHRRHTCIEAIHLTLQIIGSKQGQMKFENEEIQMFTSNHNPIGGRGHPAPTKSESTGLLLLQHHFLIQSNARLTMFLPRAATTTTWATACLAADTDIRLSDGSFAPIQQSVGRKIWTNQPHPRTIIRIHKFDTLATDPPLCLIKGN